MELVLFVGLQASGKSTFYRSRFLSSHVLVTKDAWPNARNKDRRQMRDVRAALELGRDVVVDNTNPSRGDRAALIALGRELGARIVGYYFSSSVAEALQRNAGREGRACVPEVGILATAARLQRPQLEEGFHVLYYVRILDGGLDVQDYIG